MTREIHPDINVWDKVKRLYHFVDHLNVNDVEKWTTFMDALEYGQVRLGLDQLGVPPTRPQQTYRKGEDPFHNKIARELDEMKRRPETAPRRTSW